MVIVVSIVWLMATILAILSLKLDWGTPRASKGMLIDLSLAVLQLGGAIGFFSLSFQDPAQVTYGLDWWIFYGLVAGPILLLINAYRCTVSSKINQQEQNAKHQQPMH